MEEIKVITEIPLASGDVTPDDNPHFYIEVGGVFRRLTLAQLTDCLSDDLDVGGLSNTAKQALLACFEKVAWVDDQGQTYYDALYNALYPRPTSITAVFTQGGATIYDTQTIDDLKQYLVVNAVFEDGTEHTVADYTLSGTLTPGTSVITVTYDRCTTTFNVDVTENFGYITVEYTQSGTVYDSDTLDDLKDDLVVTYFESQQVQQGVVLNDEDYTLSGTLEAGTSTITATYLGLTDTFSVTVAADPSYITAVFTQPQTPIFTDDALDTLKSNLVVTLFRRPGEAGTVLADSAYTLSGTLTEGTSAITAGYQGLTATFSVTGVVDFYNQYYWDSNSSGTNALTRLTGNGTDVTVDNVKLGIKYNDQSSLTNVRRHFVTLRGKQVMINNTDSLPSNYYPIPVPSEATKATCVITPSTQSFAAYLYKYVPNSDPSGVGYDYEYIDFPNGWHDGSQIIEFTADTNLFLAFNCRKNASNGAYDPTDEPRMQITFE